MDKDLCLNGIPLDLDDGTHLVRVVATILWGLRSRTHLHLNTDPGRPRRKLISPVKISSDAEHLPDTPAVTFRWDPAPYAGEPTCFALPQNISSSARTRTSARRCSM